MKVPLYILYIDVFIVNPGSIISVGEWGSGEYISLLHKKT